jgi:hypothetical protein
VAVGVRDGVTVLVGVSVVGWGERVTGVRLVGVGVAVRVGVLVAVEVAVAVSLGNTRGEPSGTAAGVPVGVRPAAKAVDNGGTLTAIAAIPATRSGIRPNERTHRRSSHSADLWRSRST